MPKTPSRPTDDGITIRWLVDHVPFKFWSIALSALTASAVGGFTLATTLRPPCSFSEVNILRGQKEVLLNELADLAAKKTRLSVEVSGLEIDREVTNMTNGQVRDALKKWTRP